MESGLPSLTISYPVVGKRERRNGRHPAQKPVGLMERLIAFFTKPGDKVLDPFAGTGALGVAPQRRGREFVLIEQDPGYHAIAERNLAEERDEPIGTLHRWAELRDEPLTEREIDILDREVVPQADRLDIVLDVIDIVSAGAKSPTAIATGLSNEERSGYDPRQGHYYAHAAVALGWIERDQQSKELGVTARGEEVRAAEGRRKQRLVTEDVRREPHFAFVADLLEVDLAQGIPDEDAFERALAQAFDLEESTARRRLRTIQHWLRDCHSQDLRA